MDDDDFGELYGNQAHVGLSSGGAGSLHNSHSGYAIFDDESEEEKAHLTTSAVQARPSSPPPRPKMANSPSPVAEHQRSDQPANRDSDEDDDMLLLGYNSKLGFAARKVSADSKPAIKMEDPEEDFAELIEISNTENVTENGLSPLSFKSSRASALSLPGIMSTEELNLTSGSNHMGGHTDGLEVLNHSVTIPGLSATVNATFFDMGDNGDASQDAWEQQQVEKSHLKPDAGLAMNAMDDWDSDSDDDIHIVLNTDYPYYAPGEKGTSTRYEEEEDEDDEDLIIFAGGEPNEEGEDQLLQPADAQASQGDGLGEKQTGAEDNKTHLDKALAGAPPPSQGPRGYGYHTYNSHYKYVRAGATNIYGTSAGQTQGGRGGPLKLIGGRGDWRGPGRGAFGLHPSSQFSSWSAPSSYEFTLPPSMTVFEVDLDSFDEKPWRQSAVDVSDFFNFGFDEATWKDYCKQLAQLRLESTMQSKIRVYESGRNEQDYDPDLPPELAVAAGLHEGGEKIQQRLSEIDNTPAIGTGRRGYMSMPLGRPIEVEGGLGDRRPSTDSRKQRIRDIDSIVLIDAVDIEDLEVERLQDDNVEAIDADADKDELEEQQHDMEQEEEEEEASVEKSRATYKMKREQQFWQKERMPQAMSKPVAEERRDADLMRSCSLDLHQETASKPEKVTSEKESRPSEEGDTEAHKDVGNMVHDGEHHGGVPDGQRINESTAATSKERFSREVQADSSGCSSKRQRLVSPEGSHTASWDNGDNQKSARSGAYARESRDSGESAMDCKGDVVRHRKKHRGYSDLNKGDPYKNVREEADLSKKKLAPSRHEAESEHPYTDSWWETKKRPKQMLSEKNMSKELLRHSKDRDEPRLKGRDDEGERKSHSAREFVHNKEKVQSRSEATKRDDEDKETAHHKDKGGSRPESRRGKEGERRDRHDSRRRDSEDRRERTGEDSQHRDSKEIHHRDKDAESTDWHSSDRRKKDDEHRRKERLEDAVMKKERERNTVERHDRDSDQHLRRKEDDSVKKEKHEDRHKSKNRDVTSKESEDLRQRNTDHQDSHGRAHKDDERVPYSGRSGRRHDDDRAWRGREESRLSDSTRSVEARSHSKDKRKGLDDHGKEKSRLHEGRAARSSIDHEGLPVSETYDRESAKHARLSDDPRVFERVFQSDKHKFDSKRAKELDKEVSELASSLGDSADINKKKLSGTDKSEQGNRKKMDDSTNARIREGQGRKAHNKESVELNESSKLGSKGQLFGAEDRGSSGEDEQQRGRSKLERWMSHKDLESNICERLSKQSLSRKDEKLRTGSRDKQARGSPGLRDDLEQENRHHVSERKNAKGSVSTEQANGKASKPKEKVDALAPSKDVDVHADKNDSITDPPDRLQDDTTVLRTNMAAKLEKRKERFKTLVGDKDSAHNKLDQEENVQLEKDDSRQERPPRKRRWASG